MEKAKDIYSGMEIYAGGLCPAVNTSLGLFEEQKIIFSYVISSFRFSIIPYPNLGGTRPKFARPKNGLHRSIV